MLATWESELNWQKVTCILWCLCLPVPHCQPPTTRHFHVIWGNFISQPRMNGSISKGRMLNQFQNISHIDMFILESLEIIILVCNFSHWNLLICRAWSQEPYFDSDHITVCSTTTTTAACHDVLSPCQCCDAVVCGGLVRLARLGGGCLFIHPSRGSLSFD